MLHDSNGLLNNKPDLRHKKLANKNRILTNLNLFQFLPVFIQHLTLMLQRIISFRA